MCAWDEGNARLLSLDPDAGIVDADTGEAGETDSIFFPVHADLRRNHSAVITCLRSNLFLE